jgi:putative ABC transport system permease protein
VLYVATPDLLAHLGLSGRPIDPATDVLTIRTGDLAYVNGPRAEAPTPKVETIDVPSYSSPPTSLITVNGLRRAGWQAQRAGWLIETRTPLTAAQLRAARDMAAGSGLTVEARDPQRTLGAIQTSATAAGALLALGVLAMTVGLIRSESAADLRTLTAAGATSRVRRTITATTAAALGLLGVVIGTATAYVGLIGGYSGKLGALGHVPIVHLAVTCVGVPTVAGVAGWLLAGREPATLGRTTFA